MLTFIGGTVATVFALQIAIAIVLFSIGIYFVLHEGTDHD